jgi:hypothetical protein
LDRFGDLVVVFPRGKAAARIALKNHA